MNLNQLTRDELSLLIEALDSMPIEPCKNDVTRRVIEAIDKKEIDIRELMVNPEKVYLKMSESMSRELQLKKEAVDILKGKLTLFKKGMPEKPDNN